MTDEYIVSLETFPRQTAPTNENLQKKKEESNPEKEKDDCKCHIVLNVILLIFLHFLQGALSGFLLSMQFVLSEKNTSYTDQGLFSLSAWPSTVKLLWAPIVDSLYIEKIGRRKSWLVPIQYLIGVILIGTASYVNHVLGENSTVNIHNEIYYLTGLFTLFVGLAATQDIAVDGWGITIFAKEKQEWASICHNVGGSTGVLVGNSIFLIVNSADLCNKYFRNLVGLEHQDYGLMNIQVFMIVFGIIFILSTSIILLFVNERNDQGYDENLPEKSATIVSTYKSMLRLLKLRPMQKLITFLLTWMVAFGLMKITAVKLIEMGIKKETIGMINIPIQILQIIAPILIGKFFTLKKPLNLFFKLYPIRMLATGLLAAWIYSGEHFKDSLFGGGEDYGCVIFLVVFAIINGFYSLIMSALDIAKLCFFVQISDRTIGGTYMTFLHTFSHIGYNWPITFAFYLLQVFSQSACIISNQKNNATKSLVASTEELSNNKKNVSMYTLVHLTNNTCDSNIQKNACLKLGGDCTNTSDAYYYLTGAFLSIGLVWFFIYKNVLKKLEALPAKAWTK